MRLLLIGLAMLCFSTVVSSAEPSGRITSVEGLTYLQRGFQRVLCKVGMDVNANDILRTFDDGRLTVTFVDDTSIALGPETLVKIDEYLFDLSTYEGVFEATLEDGTLAIQSGRLRTEGDPQIRIRTKQSVLGVQGTRAILDAG